jgi:hypothetical protein
MNLASTKLPLHKTKLEELCVLYLRQFPRCSSLRYIIVDRPKTGNTNWIVAEMLPPLSVAATYLAKIALNDLQQVFRMVG